MQIDVCRITAALTACMFWSAAAPGVEWQLGPSQWSLTGYLRQYVSWNLEDPEFPRTNNAGEISMLRTQLRADLVVDDLLRLPAGRVSLFASLRLVDERQTDYQDELAQQPLRFRSSAEFSTALAATDFLRFGAFNAINGSDENLVPELNAQGAGLPPGAFLNTGDYTDYYENYQFPLRELYLDIPVTKRVSLRIGKQQVVWGDTDFFVGSDLMHGFDQSWRSVFEGNQLEELRKPNFLINLQWQVPKFKGSVQTIVRPPGIDREEDIGNSLDLFGGRWAGKPNLGLDFLNFTNFNYHHAEGDIDDVTGGLRWSGRWREFKYAFQWLHTFNQEPMLNPCTAGPNCFWANTMVPDPASGFTTPILFSDTMRAPLGGEQPQPGPVQLRNPAGGLYLGEIIYPIRDTIGFNTDVYVNWLDAVFAAEVAYTIDKPFHTGSLGRQSKNATCDFVLCGFAGLIEKDIIRWTFRLDWQARWTQRPPLGKLPFIGSHRPAFLTLQIFDTQIINFKKDNDIVQLVGLAKRAKRHQPLITSILSMPYFNDRMTFGLVVGVDGADLRNGFLIPSLDLVRGDHWRVRLEADLIWDDGSRVGGERSTPPNLNEPGSTRGQGRDASLFSLLDGADQFLIKVSYQF